MSDQNTRYRVLSTDYGLRLTSLVNDAMNEGWKVHGCPFVDKCGHACQAMVLVEEDDDE
jgi:hypothetical protein